MKESDQIERWLQGIEHTCAGGKTPLCNRGLCEKLKEILRKRAYSYKFNGIPLQGIEDILQNSIIAIYNGVASQQFLNVKSFEKWANRIITFKWADYFRDQENNEVPIDDDNNDKPDENYNIEQFIDEDELYKVLKEMVRSGKKECADLIMICYTKFKEGTKLKEIAEQLGYPTPNALSQAKNRCLELARNLYREDF